MVEIAEWVAGQTVVELLEGPWDPFPGAPLPGIASSVWHDSPGYLYLGNGSVIELNAREAKVLSQPGPLTTQPVNSHERSCVGRSILDIVRTAEDEVVVLLSGGQFLENASLPAGSRLHLGDLADWTPEELAAPVISLLTERVYALKSSV